MHYVQKLTELQDNFKVPVAIKEDLWMVDFCNTYLEVPQLTEVLEQLEPNKTTEQRYEIARKLRLHPTVGPWLRAIDKFLSERLKENLGLEVDLMTALADLPLDSLSRKQRHFVLCYHGDPDDAMAQAGYKVTPQNKCNLLTNPIIKTCIREIDKLTESALVASALECKMFLTDVMKNNDVPANHRMLAAKSLLKAKGEDRPQQAGPGTAVQVNIQTHMGTGSDEYATVKLNSID